MLNLFCVSSAVLFPSSTFLEVPPYVIFCSLGLVAVFLILVASGLLYIRKEFIFVCFFFIFLIFSNLFGETFSLDYLRATAGAFGLFVFAYLSGTVLPSLFKRLFIFVAGLSLVEAVFVLAAPYGLEVGFGVQRYAAVKGQLIILALGLSMLNYPSALKRIIGLLLCVCGVFVLVMLASRSGLLAFLFALVSIFTLKSSANRSAAIFLFAFVFLFLGICWSLISGIRLTRDSFLRVWH